MRIVPIISGSLFLLALNLALAAPIPKEELPKYLRMLTAKSPADRALAARKLGEHGRISSRDVAEAVEPLKKIARNDTDITARRAATEALGDIGVKAETTVPLLIEVLEKDNSQDVKLAAVRSLAKYGSDAQATVQPIRDFGKNFDKKSAGAATVQSALSLITGKKKKN